MTTIVALGEEPPKPKGIITEPNEDFKKWVKDNGERIAQATTLPYWYKDNKQYVKPAQKNEPTTKEIAERRHAARTPEQVAAIKKAWNDRKATYHYGRNMLRVMGGISDVDTSALSDALRRGDQTAILAEGAKLKAIGKQITALTHLDKPLQVAKDYSMADAVAVSKAVNKTIESWLAKYNYADWDRAPLGHKQAKLKFEIDELTTSQKYKTWRVAKEAYGKKLTTVQEALDFESYTKSLQEHKMFLVDSSTKSITYKKNIKKLANAIALKDKASAQAAISILDAKKKELEKGASIIVPKSTNSTPQKKHIGYRFSLKERINKIMEMTGVTDKSVAKDYNDAVYGFSYKWDYEIRQVQMGNNNIISRHGHTIEEITKKAKDLESFIAKSPQWRGATTYRGMSLSDKELENMRMEMKLGNGNMQGSASWSTREEVSKQFAGSHIGKISPVYGDVKTNKVVLVSEKGHKKATSIQHLSEFPTEEEVLASFGSRYQFIGEQKKGDYIYLYVTPK